MPKSYTQTVQDARTNTPTVDLAGGTTVPDSTNRVYNGVTQFLNEGAKIAKGVIDNARSTYYDKNSFTGGFKESYEFGKIDRYQQPRPATTEQMIGAARSVQANARESFDDY